MAAYCTAPRLKFLTNLRLPPQINTQLLSCLQGNIIDSHQYGIGALAYRSRPRSLLRINCNIRLVEDARKVPYLNDTDRFLFVWLYHWFPSVLGVIAIVRPETIIRWHRTGFRAYWRWRSRNHVGRPKVSAELRALIGEISRANPLWGAPHIHGELLKLGFEVAQSIVARYIPPLAATISRLAHVSEQPCRRHRSGRPFCPSNDRVPDPLLPCHHTAWTTDLGVVWRDGKPDCGVDLAPDHRGFPMGPRVAIPHSGSGRLVRASLRAASARHGYSRSADCVPITLAKRLR